MHIQTWLPNQPYRLRGSSQIGTTGLVIAFGLVVVGLVGAHQLGVFFAGDPASVASVLERWAEAVSG